MLPADGHVHSQFSWDTDAGDMEATCARAVAIGLPALAFTEHVDFTPWATHGLALPTRYRGHLDEHGSFLADSLDADGYLACIERCRGLFPELRIRSGIELSEGHWHPEKTRALLARGQFDRVLGSVHALVDLEHDAEGGSHVETATGYAQRAPVDVVRAYLGEVAAMAASDAPFSVLAHIDYPLRSWPPDVPALDLRGVEAELRAALTALAASGRALEVNTRMPVNPLVLDWWHDAGGDAVVFGSDAHEPDALARDFAQTASLVEAHGYRPGPRPFDHWGRA